MKKGYKDHFGNISSQFDRINKQNKTKTEDISLEAQLKRAAAQEKAERAQSVKEKAEKQKAAEAPKYAWWAKA